MTFSSKNYLANKNTASSFFPPRISNSIINYNNSTSYLVLLANTTTPSYVQTFLPKPKYINSNSTTLPSLVSSFNGTYANQVIVNNGTNNWTLTLPLGPGGGTSTWITGTFKLYIKKTGSGTLTIQTPADSAGVRVRGINTTSNKSYILSNSSTQAIQLMYTSGYTNNGSVDTTAEIWHVVNESSLNITSSNGSILFNGTGTTYLTLAANDNQLLFRTDDFTVEWWQYQTDSNGAPRIFSFGTYPTATFGVSIEGGTFYLWIDGAANSFGSVGTYKNVFTHFAVTRSGTTIRVFKNGTQLGSNLTSSYDFNDTTNNLRIGNEQSLTTNAAFGGNLKGFHWVKGTALYTSTFTPNYNSISPVANTCLLLNVHNSSNLVTDNSGLGKIVTNSNCTFSSITHPFY